MGGLYGGFHKWGYPQSSSILMGFFLRNHPFLGFPMVFLWFSSGFPMVFLWFSYGFPMVFLWVSYGFPMVWGTPFKRLRRGLGKRLTSCRLPPTMRGSPCRRAMSCIGSSCASTAGEGRSRCHGVLHGDNMGIWGFPES